MMATPSPEKHIGAPRGTEAAPAVVSQPVKIESHLNAQLGSFLEEVNRISETAASAPGENKGDGSTTAVTAAGTSAKTTFSVRDQAIANIPAPAVMQKELAKHIHGEVKKLRKQAQTIARLGKPGAAYRLNQLYLRIRHLNSLLAEIFESSVDVVKRLFIRVFIDRQPIL